MVQLDDSVYYAFRYYLSSLDALLFPQQVIDIIDDAECFLASIGLSEEESDACLALLSKECDALHYDVDVLLDFVGSLPLVSESAQQDESLAVLRTIEEYYRTLFNFD